MTKYNKYIRFKIMDKESKENKSVNDKCRVLIFTIVLVLLVSICLYCGSKSWLEVNRSRWSYYIFTVVMLFLFVCLRDIWFSKFIFMWKDEYLNEYYGEIDKRIRDLKIHEEQKEENLIFISTGPNGKMIGLLESFLYLGAFFMRSVSFIGIILAVRSYVAVSSHPNKEESEFYIMGVLGSLLYSLMFAFLYAWISACYFGISWFLWIRG